MSNLAFPLSLPSLELDDETLKTIGMYSCEARPDFDRFRSPSYHPREHWFFLHQCSIAHEHLTEVQKCDVETITYAGVVNGKHTWLARS
jgi:hypothetical protein